MFRRRRRQQTVIDVLSGVLTKEFPRIRAGLEILDVKLNRMERMMSAELDALNEIKAKLADLLDDVKARLDVVAGELSAEGKSEVESIKDSIDAFHAEIGDADGSDTPEAPPVDNTPTV